MHCNLSSNVFDPEIKLDGKWEVAVYDLALGDDLLSTSTATTTMTTNVTEQIELCKKDFPILGHPPKEAECYNSFSMLLKAHIAKCERLLRPSIEAGTTALREAFKRFGYGNRGTSHLSSQFDIWNYQIPLLKYGNRIQWLFIDGEWLHSYWNEDPNRVLTVEELFNEITTQISVKMVGAYGYLKGLFKGTSGEKIVTELPYLYAPEMKYIISSCMLTNGIYQGTFICMNGFMQIKVPWYIPLVNMHEDIANSVQLKTYGDWGRFKKLFERKVVEVPCTLT